MDRDELLLGYTKYRSDLVRRDCVRSRRAHVIRADGSGRGELAPQLAAEPNCSTEVVGWSPDGGQAIIHANWQSDENAAYEEEHRRLRLDEGFRVDCCLVDMASGEVRNLTAVERVSNYNAALRFQADGARLQFVAVMAPGDERLYTMALDGTDKRASSLDACGLSISGDGTRVAHSQGYQIHLADADGGNAMQVQTGLPYNHQPLWSPDGQWVLFVAGEMNNSHPHVVRRDGTGLRQVGDLNGHEGWASDYDTPDYRRSSGDYPCWSHDSRWIYYAARAGEAVELLRTSLGGETEQLTHSPAGTTTHSPTSSPDGKWLAFGSDATGARQLYVARPDGGDSRQLTHLAPGHAAKFFYWQNLPAAAT